MRYQVPQFIDVEDKIFGPLTLKQFIYLAGGAGLGFLIYRALPTIISLPIALLVIGFGVALAFYKPDGHRPFIFVLEQATKYVFNPKLYVWHKTPKKVEAGEESKDGVKAVDIFVPKLSDSKLRELSWSLDIHENLEHLDRK